MSEAQNWNITIDTFRGGYLESQSAVRAVVVDGNGQILMQAGDPSAPVFWRSTAKFVQALSLFSSGAIDRFSLEPQELALACGSHSGGKQHVAVAKRMLEKISASVDDLHCGPHVPLGPEEAAELAAEHLLPTKLHNNCSGKHAGMLASCRAHGFPLTDYHRNHHPLQQEILAHLSSVSGVRPEHIQTAVDGCGAVVFRTPMVGLARAYARLVGDTLPDQAAGRTILAAIGQHPELVAGPGRLCTELMSVTRGRLVAKVGADGVYALGTAQSDLGPSALAIKIADGSMRSVNAAVCKVAAALGWLQPGEFEQLHRHYHQPIFNHQKELVGDIRVAIDD